MKFISSSSTTSTTSLSDTALVAGRVALAGAAFSSALYNLFRRRIPNLTQDDLLPDPMNNDLQVDCKFREEDRAGLIEAFITSPDFVWILKDGEKAKLLLKEEQEDMEDMYSITSYIIDLAIFLGENFGHVIKSVGGNGEYQGSIVLMPPVTTLRMMAYTIAALANMGRVMPSAVWRSDDTGRMARFFACFQCEKYHHEVMQDCVEDHWYVVTLGVAPCAQGKRVGSRLLQQAIHLAGDKPLYLDCHNDNVAYYEKFGFQCKRNYALETSKGGKSSSNSTFYMNAMRRDPLQ